MQFWINGNFARTVKIITHFKAILLLKFKLIFAPSVSWNEFATEESWNFSDSFITKRVVNKIKRKVLIEISCTCNLFPNPNGYLIYPCACWKSSYQTKLRLQNSKQQTIYSTVLLYNGEETLHQKFIRHRYTLLRNLIGLLRFQLISDGTVSADPNKSLFVFDLNTLAFLDFFERKQHRVFSSLMYLSVTVDAPDAGNKCVDCDWFSSSGVMGTSRRKGEFLGTDFNQNNLFVKLTWILIFRSNAARTHPSEEECACCYNNWFWFLK